MEFKFWCLGEFNCENCKVVGFEICILIDIGYHSIDALIDTCLSNDFPQLAHNRMCQLFGLYINTHTLFSKKISLLEQYEEIADITMAYILCNLHINMDLHVLLHHSFTLHNQDCDVKAWVRSIECLEHDTRSGSFFRHINWGEIERHLPADMGPACLKYMTSIYYVMMVKSVT